MDYKMILAQLSLLAVCACTTAAPTPAARAPVPARPAGPSATEAAQPAPQPAEQSPETPVFKDPGNLPTPMPARTRKLAEPLNETEVRYQANPQETLEEAAKRRPPMATRAELELWADEMQATNQIIEMLHRRPLSRGSFQGWYCFSTIDKNRRPPMVSSACFRTIEICQEWREMSEGARKETVPCIKKDTSFCMRARDALENHEFSACAETPLLCDQYTKYYLVRSQRYAVVRGCQESQ